METEDLERLIEKVDKAMELLADIDLYAYTNSYTRKNNQLKLNKSYDLLFKTRNHLKYLLKRQGI